MLANAAGRVLLAQAQASRQGGGVAQYAYLAMDRGLLCEQSS